MNTTLTTGSTHDYLCFVPIEGPEVLAIGSGKDVGSRGWTSWQLSMFVNISIIENSKQFNFLHIDMVFFFSITCSYK